MPLIFKCSAQASQFQVVDVPAPKSKQKRVGIKRANVNKKIEGVQEKNVFQKDIPTVAMNRKMARAALARNGNLKRSQSTRRSKSPSHRKIVEQAKVVTKKPELTEAPILNRNHVTKKSELTEAPILNRNHRSNSNMKIKEEINNVTKKPEPKAFPRMSVDELDNKREAHNDVLDQTQEADNNMPQLNDVPDEEVRDEVEKYENTYEQDEPYRSHFRFDEYGSVSQEEQSCTMFPVKEKTHDQQKEISQNPQANNGAFSNTVASAGALAVGATLMVGEGVHTVVQKAIMSMNSCTMKDAETESSHQEKDPQEIYQDNANILRMIQDIDGLELTARKSTASSQGTRLTAHNNRKVSSFSRDNMNCLNANTDSYLSGIDRCSTQSYGHQNPVYGLDTYVDSFSQVSANRVGSCDESRKEELYMI